jgi:hypothetical protein
MEWKGKGREGEGENEDGCGAFAFFIFILQTASSWESFEDGVGAGGVVPGTRGAWRGRRFGRLRTSRKPSRRPRL